MTWRYHHSNECSEDSQNHHPRFHERDEIR